MNPLQMLACAAALALTGCTTTRPTYYDESATDDRALLRSIVLLTTLETDSLYAYGTGITVAGRRGTYIMTAYHVINGSLKVWARFENDTEHFPHPLRFIGGDRLFDVAFFVPDTSDRTFDHAPVALAWADSRILDEAPFRTIEVKYVGFQSGILMRHIGRVLNGNIPGYALGSPQPSLIMSTAHFNGGGSGSALLDEWNRILGLNVSIIHTTMNSRWLNPTSISVPSNDIRMVLGKIERGETTEHATLSVDYENTRDMPRENLRERKVPVPIGHGVVITTVVDSSTAKSADLRPGDLIMSVDGNPILTSKDLYRTFQTKLVPGRPVHIYIFRNDVVLSKIVMPQK